MMRAFAMSKCIVVYRCIYIQSVMYFNVYTYAQVKGSLIAQRNESKNSSRQNV